jgi:hypothetical protein
LSRDRHTFVQQAFEDSSVVIIKMTRQVVLEAYLHDNEQAYDLVDGAYRRVRAVDGEPRVSAQRLLLDWYTIG